MRKARDMERLANTTDSRVSKVNDSMQASKLTIGRIDPTYEQRPSQAKVNPWANFWKEKKQNNQEYLIAAETGDLETVRQMLDPKLKQAAVADINTTLDGFSALHFAASEC